MGIVDNLRQRVFESGERIRQIIGTLPALEITDDAPSIAPRALKPQVARPQRATRPTSNRADSEIAAIDGARIRADRASRVQISLRVDVEVKALLERMVNHFELSQQDVIVDAILAMALEAGLAGPSIDQDENGRKE
jgi:hypothetical protein